MSTEQDGPAEEPTAASEDSASQDSASQDRATGSEETSGESHREYLRGWFTGRLPAGWFTSAPSIEADREEITVVGALPDPETEAGASDAEKAAAAEGQIGRAHV